MYQSLIQKGKKRTKQKEKGRNIMYADDDQEYVVVRELMGGGRVKVLCGDNVERLGRIRGSMRHSRHRVLIEKGDLLIASGRGDFDEDKVDILHKYHHEEARHVVSLGIVKEPVAKTWGQLDGGVNNHTTDNDEFIEFRDSEDAIRDL